MYEVRVDTSLPGHPNGGLAWGVPPLPGSLLLRRRLYRRLNSAIHDKVVVVTGPPGSGKSALVSSWVKYADPADVIWLSLTPHDGCSPDLWDMVAIDVAQLTDRASTNELAGTDSTASVRELHPGKAAEEKQILLVIDNIDHIRDTDLISKFDEFVYSLNQAVGLILIGRHWGDLPLHQLAMHVGLTEINGGDLALSVQETAEFLVAWGPPVLPDGCLEELTTRLEGWAAGVRLASLILPEIADGIDALDYLHTDLGLIAYYFRREVFEKQSEATREFMRRTAVLDVMQPDLCNAVTGRRDSLAVLERLSRQNAFVRATGGPNQFRYHTLFREFLCHVLTLDEDGIETEARLRAARWYEQNNDRASAVYQLNHPSCYDELFKVGVKSAQQGVNLRFPPEPDTMLPAGLPDSYFEDDPARMYPLCVSMLLRSDLDGAAKWLRRWESAMGTPTGDVRLLARCELTWAIFDLASLNPEGALRHLASIGPLSDAGAPRPPQSPIEEQDVSLRELDAALVAVAPILRARAELWLGKAERSRSILLDAYGMDRATGDSLLAGSLAAVFVADGNLHPAKELATRALAQVEDDGGVDAIVTVDSHVALARVLYEQDDLPSSEAHLKTADLICRSNGLLSWSPVFEREFARLDLARGRPRDALRRLEALRRNEPLNEVAPMRAEALGLEVRCRIVLNDLLGAEDLLGDWPTGEPDAELVARFYLASGRPDRAMSLLNRPNPTAPSVAATIERLLLQTRIHLQTGNLRGADHCLQRAVNVAKPEGYVRVFLDEPAQTGELLRSLATEDADSFVETLRAKYGEVKRRQTDPLPLHIEPLTERERELLGYLPCHLSQLEIARRMFISANTVKTHVKALYRKLGASSRAEAVEIASRCGLIDQRQSA